MRLLAALLIAAALAVAQIPKPTGSASVSGGSGTVTEVTGSAGITCINGTTTPDCSLDRTVAPYKGVTTETTPANSNFASGDIQAVDTDGTPQFHVCATDDGGAPPACTLWIRLARYTEVLLLSGGTLTGQLTTDNLGIEFEESDTNPTCAAGNFNIYADASENKLKACQNGTPSDLVGSGGTGTTHQVFMNLSGNTVASTTTYAGPNGASFSTENARAFMVTRATTFTKIYARTTGSQGACDAVVTLRNTSTATDTAITFTISNGHTGGGTWSDTAHTADFTAGQRGVIKVASTTCTSEAFTEISLEYN